MRDRELMEMHPNEMNKDSEVNRKKKKKVIRKIKKEKTRNHDFHYITKPKNTSRKRCRWENNKNPHKKKSN